MKGIGGKQAESYETVVTVAGDGESLTAGDTITFTKPFENVPCGMVVCPLGTVDLKGIGGADQPASVWKVSCTMNQCVISLVDGAVTPLPDAFHSAKIRVGIIVQEQL